MTNEAKDIDEVEVDQALVEDATKKVMGLIEANHNNSIEVGRCLIEKFYDNNFDYARKGKKVKDKSLNKMLNDLQDLPNTPSKSWFYNTINLAVDAEAFKYDPDYSKLNLTQKICLTYLSKEEKWQAPKHDLIKEVAKLNMPIKELNDRISEIKGRRVTELPSFEVFLGMADKDKNKCTKKATQRQKTLQKAIKNLKAKLDEQETELKRCIEIINVAKMPADSRSEQLADQTDQEPVNQTLEAA
jgi:hypothetical protein